MQSSRENNKVHISIHVDSDVLIAYKYKAKSTGDNYQNIMNKALEQYLQQMSITDTIKNVIREELRSKE